MQQSAFRLGKRRLYTLDDVVAANRGRAQPEPAEPTKCPNDSTRQPQEGRAVKMAVMLDMIHDLSQRSQRPSGNRA